MDLRTFLSILPNLIGLAIQFYQLLVTRSNQSSDPAAMIGQVRQALSALELASSHADHQDAAQALALALAGQRPSPTPSPPPETTHALEP